MKLNIINIRKSINKAFLKVKPNRAQIENFKKNILSLYDQINESESEEYHKNIISKFLSDTYYAPNHYINTKGRTDLVIHNGKDSSTTVGVLIETKKPSNKSEMPTKDNLNAKALQELILYYLRERISGKNIEVKHLIVTNIYEWFIFNVNDFDRLFAQNKKLVKQFTDFEEGRLADTKTDFFYKQIAEPFLNDLDSEISFTHLDIRKYEKIIKNNDKLDDNKLVALFKLFSPENILKLPFANDSNSLDKGFYSELLHLIGLEETKEGSKKLIGRKAEKERNAGSLIENTITILNYEDCLSQIKASDYGATKDYQLYNVALELVITWINRVLFLKLLEGQLIKYHSGDKSFKFLNIERIPDFDALNKLFFQVLAIKENERNDLVKQKFGNIPYLNSSLFEPNDLEHKTVRVSNLEDEYSLPILSSTVLKDKTGKKQSGELNTLEYLFAFLDSYDFASEGAEEIQEENKTLINASVLGLIFEKINGYKDGSFFTPGFITMYMCRETIRRATIQKFNETKNWKCKTIDDLYDKIEDKQEANKIINDLKICDPAVGSGHFLVSALNEIIAVKNDLRILSDREGKRLKEYYVEVVNDELVVTDEDGELFEYNPKNKESQRIQETLFHEKKTIIENCLFGVDINQNSVKICRLRLWIELLKNAYYKSGTEELETLPNIDINIKCGNSLISRFALDSDLKQALRKSESKWTIDSYRLAVSTYRHAISKEQKHEMERLINEIKTNFRSEISQNDPKVKRLRKLNGELFTLTNQGQLFELSKKEKTEWNKNVKKLTEQTQKLEKEIEEIKSNKIYENAFEWRFEFPEVLNDEGDYIGFDAIIGNPPYIRVQDLMHEAIDFYKTSFNVAFKRIDISVLFLELGYNILGDDGLLTYITSNQFLKAEYGREARKFLKNKMELNIDYSKLSVFEGLATYVSIFLISKKENTKVDYELMEIVDEQPKNLISFDSKQFTDEPWDFNINQDLKNKIFKEKSNLNDIANFTYGVITGCDKAFLVPYDVANDLHLEKTITKNFIRPQNYNKYTHKNQTFSLIYPYKHDNSIITEYEFQKEYPNCYSFLLQFKTELENRKDSRTTIKEKGLEWYSIMRRVDLNEINIDKIVFYDVGMHPNFIIDNNHNIFGGGTSHSLRITDSDYQIEYILGLLNSKLMEWVIYDLCPVKMGDARKYGLDYIRKLPIVKPDDFTQSEISNIVKLIMSHKNESKDTFKLEKDLDKLIYQLYDLTEEEIITLEESL